MSAKSRLTASKIAELQRTQVEPNRNTDLKRPRREQIRIKEQSTHSLNTILAARIRRSYLLLFAIPGYLAVLDIFSTTPPKQIAHWLVPFGFLPLQAALLWGNFWMFTWVFMNTGRGARASLLFILILSLKLQSVAMHWWLIAGIVFLFIGHECMKLLLMHKKE